MKKGIVVIIALIYSLLSVNLLFAATFTQADLTGTWRMNGLRTGYQSDGVTPRNEWVRARVTINSSGVASCLSYRDSTGVTECPDPFGLTFTMDETTGVITQSGANAPNAGTDHMTMSLNKNFAAGTATNGSGPGHSYQLVIVQKEVPGTTYSASDLENKSFVYHQLFVGDDSGWSYGAGTIGPTGLVTISSATDSWGSGETGTVGTMLVDGNGVVTIDNDASFQGFLSDDKKTFVATNNGSESGSPQLLIVQITGKTYTAGLASANTSVAHMLGCGAIAFWAHRTDTVDGNGVMHFSDWVASNPAITAPTETLTVYIDATGTVTIEGSPTYHGQASDDGTFIVGTQTLGTYPFSAYALTVNTKVPSADTSLYANFGASGVWEWNGTTWNQINAGNPTSMTASGSLLYANFGASGVWVWNGTTWNQINAGNPSSMVTN
jgi:hypothetical protein